MQTENVRVVVLGTGQMGDGIIKLLLQKTGIELVGVYEVKPERSGVDVGMAIGLDRKIGVTITDDLPTLLNTTKPQIALMATASKVVQVAENIKTLVRHGVNVISIAEEMAFPAYEAPDIATELHTLAQQHNVTVLGTGINPGFVLDLLVVTLTGVCQHVESITAKRINDLSPYGPTVLSTQGVGLTPEAFEVGLQDGSVVGHFGFPESISMIAKALGWRIDLIEQQRQPIISAVERETPFVKIMPGLVAGCHHTAVAYMDDRPVITLIHPQQVHPHLENVKTGDYIEIIGSPDLNFVSEPEIPGGKGTMALAVNMIPHVINSAPGLKSMTDLPAPAALMGDVRKFIFDF